MSRGCLLVLIVALAVIATAGSVAAQPRQGDIVFTAFSTGPGIYYAPWTGAMRTLRSGLQLSGVKMGYGNIDAYVTYYNSPRVYRVTSAGATYVYNTIAPPAEAIALDQDGGYMLACSSARMLYKVSGSAASAFVSIPTTYGSPNAICRDGNTGDWIVGTYYSSTRGYVLRVNRVTKSISTVAYMAGGVYGVDWIPQTGEYAVVNWYGGQTYLSFLRSTGSLRARYAIPSANCVTVDQKQGVIFVGTSGGRIYRYYYTGSYQGYRTMGSYTISGIDIWQDQNVSAYAYPHRMVRLYLRFPRSPSKSYYVALSTAPYPGIRLGTYQWINLRGDSLFFLTLLNRTPYFTYRFTGILDSNGYGNAYFVLPYTPVRVYASAVAVNTAFPNNVDVGNTVVVDNW